MSNEISTLLLRWYDVHARVLPWRGIHDPYRTWVSETMLQQTRVETVRGYYDRFLAAFPTVQALAEAQEDEVLKLWEGLGYYSRARNLHQAAQQVVRDFGGVIPAHPEKLLQLKGIGVYTAGAIASIAYDVPVPAVDGNVIRVVSRLKGIRENVGNLPVRRRIEAEAAALVDRERPGDYNQAVMDLGSSICTPGTPDCERCPLRAHCDACAAGDAENLPILPQKNPPKQLPWDVLLIFSGNRILMRQRTEALLRGMWVFPMLPGHAQEEEWDAFGTHFGLTVQNVRFLGDARHVFTHQIWQMKRYAMTTDAQKPPRGYQFVTISEINQLAIPTAMKAACEDLRKIFGTNKK